MSEIRPTLASSVRSLGAVPAARAWRWGRLPVFAAIALARPLWHFAAQQPARDPQTLASLLPRRRPSLGLAAATRWGAERTRPVRGNLDPLSLRA